MFRLVLLMDPRVQEQLADVDAVFLQAWLQQVSSEAVSEVEAGEERKHGELYVSPQEIGFTIVTDRMRDPTQLYLFCAASTRYAREDRMKRWGRMLKRAVFALYQEPRLRDVLQGKAIEVQVAQPLPDE